MKRKQLFIILSLFAATFCLQATQPVRVIAHRGYWKTEGSAQNSLRSLDMAASIGVYGAEFDVHLTSDNIPVIFHDDTLRGYAIQSTPYETIKDLELPNGEKLPTLAAYLQRSLAYPGIQLILELKPHQTPSRNREAARMVVEMIEQSGLKERTEYITFNRDAGEELIRITPGSEIAYLNGDLSPVQLKEAGYTGLDYHFRVMQRNPGWFTEARDAGLSINVWTVNDLDTMRELMEAGAHMITTDIPEEALRLVNSLNP